MNEFVKLGIWVVVIGVIFAILWYKGYLLSITKFVQETKEELHKCTWPSFEELKGSTIVVMVTIFLLGVFTVTVDLVVWYIVTLIT